MTTQAKQRYRQKPIVLERDKGQARTIDVAELVATYAPVVDLAMLSIKHQLSETGWPARSDRHRPVCQHEGECLCPVIDYSDPTGEQSSNIERLHDDLNIIQDAQDLIERQIEHIAKLSRRILGDKLDTEPICESCADTGTDEPRTVEPTDRTRRKFRGLKNDHGMWWRTSTEPKAICQPCRRAASRKKDQ